MQSSSFSERLLVKLVLALGCVAWLAGLSTLSQAGEWGPFTYRIVHNYGASENEGQEVKEAYITRCDPTTAGELVIPSELEGWPVTSFDDHAFQGCDRVTKITLSNSLGWFGSHLLDPCTALQAIEVAPGNERYASIDGVLFNKDLTTLLSYPKARQGEYTVPDGVTHISHPAFLDCAGLTHLSLPPTVEGLTGGLFRGCSQLQAFSFPEPNPAYTTVDGVLFNAAATQLLRYPGAKTGPYEIPGETSKIGWEAFSECHGLTEVTLGEQLIEIEHRAFADCSNLHAITLPDGITSLQGETFINCVSLSEVSLPAELKSIGYLAFEGCRSLTNLTIPDETESIASSAFSGCFALARIDVSPGNLTFSSDSGVLYDAPQTRLVLCSPGYPGDLTIHAGVESIDRAALADSPALTGIHVEESNPVFSSIDGVLFDASRQRLLRYPQGNPRTHYEVPDGVKELRDVSVVSEWGGGYGWGWGWYPSHDGSGAFGRCRHLRTVTLPETLTDIGSETFSGCESLEQITLPRSVTSIGGYCFHHCSNLRAIHVEEGNEHFSSTEGVLFNASGTYLIRYPQGKSNTTYAIPHGVEGVSAEVTGECGFGHVSVQGAFDDVRYLQRLLIPEGVRWMADSAFRDVTHPLAIIFLGDRQHALIRRELWDGGLDLTVYHTQASDDTGPDQNPYVYFYPTSFFEGIIDDRFYQNRMTRVQLVENRDLELEWLSNRDTLYAIEASEDMTAWHPLITHLPSAGERTAVILPQPNDPAQPRDQRYFRVRPVKPLDGNISWPHRPWTTDSNSEALQWEKVDLPGEESVQPWLVSLDEVGNGTGHASLRSPLVNLADVQRGVQLSFRYKLDADSSDLFAQVRLLDAEGDVLHTYEEHFERQASEWTPFRWWLPWELHDATVQVEFRVIRHGGEASGSWMVDDIVID